MQSQWERRTQAPKYIKDVTIATENKSSGISLLKVYSEGTNKGDAAETLS